MWWELLKFDFYDLRLGLERRFYSGLAEVGWQASRQADRSVN